MLYVKGSIYSVPMRMAFGAIIERRFLITEENDKDEQARGTCPSGTSSYNAKASDSERKTPTN